MLRPCRWLALAVLVCAPLTASAQVICAPTVTYYAAPAPVVAYAPPVVAYAPPLVTYAAPAPVVTYAAPAPVVAYAAPVVSYAAPAPVAVSTYRYGLFGRRSVTTVTYGAYASPVVVRPRRAYYYAPAYIYP